MDQTDISPTPSARQIELIRKCQTWQRDDQRRRFWTLANAARISPALDMGRLREAFRAVVNANSALRWCFSCDSENVTATILPTELFDFEVIAIQGMGSDRVQAMLTAQARDALVNFDGPLFKLTAFQSETETILLFRFHHAIVDGWTILLIIRELVLAYSTSSEPDARRTGNFNAFVGWQRRFVESIEGRRQLDYWKNLLWNMPTQLLLPFDRPENRSFTKGGTVAARLEAKAARRLQDIAQSEQITLFSVLFAGFNIVLYTMTGEPDVPVLTVSANRNHKEFRETIGWLANSIYVRARVHTDWSFRNICRSVAENTGEALAHQDYPLPLVETAVIKDQPQAKGVLGRVGFGVTMPMPSDDMEINRALNLAAGAPAKWGQHSIEMLDFESEDCVRDLTLSVRNYASATGEADIGAVLEFRGDAFNPATAQRILDLYLAALAKISSAPDSTVRDHLAELRAAFPDLCERASGTARLATTGPR